MDFEDRQMGIDPPVSTPEDDEDTEGLFDEPEDVNTHHTLHNKYTFWYHRRGGGQAKSGASYEDSIKKVGTFQTVRMGHII